ncbi:hypothetical protein Q3G72_001191 [Acer saccharum]|nr:hypothetical protein Q3G72_001191 [Acer saccharum]
MNNRAVIALSGFGTKKKKQETGFIVDTLMAALGISEEASWHAKYKDSAYVYVGGIPLISLKATSLLFLPSTRAQVQMGLHVTAQSKVIGWFCCRKL